MTTKTKKRKMVQVGFTSFNEDEFDPKALKKLLHNTLWNMRGQYGWTNISIVHTLIAKQFHEKGHPKEAMSWDYWEEAIHVVASYPSGDYRDSVQVYVHNTDTFDVDDSYIMKNVDFFKQVPRVSDLTNRYLEEVLKDRVDYFNGLTYKYKMIEPEYESIWTWDGE